jgi:hypothetical protein
MKSSKRNDERKYGKTTYSLRWKIKTKPDGTVVETVEQLVPKPIQILSIKKR